MGLFDRKRDEDQDYRLGALERHVRALTERMDMTRVDVAKGKLAMMRLQGALDEKLDEAAVDPGMARLNDMIGEARENAEKAAAAANESWDALQTGVGESIDVLMAALDEAEEEEATS